MKLQQRSFRDDDWGQFQSFCKEHFGPTHNDSREFNRYWFKTGREPGWSIQALVDDEDLIRGLMAYILVDAKFGQDTLPLAWISSTAVEDFENERGAGARLYLWIYRHFPLIGAMSGNENSEPLNKTLGQDIDGVSMDRYIKVHDIEGSARLCTQEGRRKILDFNWEAGPVSNNLRSNWLQHPPADYDVLWARFRETVYFTTERNASYFNWRYATNPYISYRFLEMRDRTNVLRGLAVIRPQPTPEGTVWRIMEFLADDEVAPQAWAHISQCATERGVLYSDFLVIGTRQNAHLREAKFHLANSSTGLEALPNLLSPVDHRIWTNTIHFGGKMAKADQRWRSPEAVYFTKGDSDRDWPTAFDMTLIDPKTGKIPVVE